MTKRIKTKFTKFNTNIPKYVINLKNYSKSSPNLDDMNHLIYGVFCKLYKKGKSTKGILYVNETKKDYLSFAQIYEEKIFNFSLNNIQTITFEEETENLKNKKIKKNTAMQFYIEKKSHDFVFENSDILNKVVNALILLYEDSHKEINKFNFEDNFEKLWTKYDKNFDKTLNKDEFQILAREIGFNKKILIDNIDVNGDGIIEYNEVLDYFKKFTGGLVYADIFNQYSTLISDKGRKVWSYKNLQYFFYDYQKESLTDYETLELLIKFKRNFDEDKKEEMLIEISELYSVNNQNIRNISNEIEQIFNKYNLELYMTLREFSNMLNNNIMSVYNKELLVEELNLDYPLVDYYINSTHNTYIKGHQLYGKSSTEMYSFAMLEGYRLVELDCYDGKDDDIIITHGYTFVSKLHLVDILVQLKKTAFINSDLPVILSIENHCNKKHQQIMAQKFKEILVDLYIFPSDNIPEFIPNLRELKRKFIIKTGGKRAQVGDKIIKRKKEIRLNINNLNHNNKFLSNFSKIFKKYEKFEKKKNLFLDIIKKKKKNNENNNIDTKNTNKSLNEKNNNNIKQNIEKLDSDDDEEDEIPEEKIETIDNLCMTRGLHGTKFYKKKIDEMKYQPWEFVTIKSTKFNNFFINPEIRKEIIKLSNHCMIKAYPQSFDSSNYDIIKCWGIGCQCAALNIQALEDDYTLYDKVFFQQNNNLGYVLKPKKFLLENVYDDDEEDENNNNNNENKTEFFEDYLKPYYIINIEIKYLFNLIELMEICNIKAKKNMNINLEIYTLGAVNDDNNPKHIFKIKEGTIFPKINNNKTISFNVYEKDLGCIMMKFKYNEITFGRACIPYIFIKEGLRKIPIYDKHCLEGSGTCVVARFFKTNYN